jgi:hypothetical protein
MTDPRDSDWGPWRLDPARTTGHASLILGQRSPARLRSQTALPHGELSASRLPQRHGNPKGEQANPHYQHRPRRRGVGRPLQGREATAPSGHASRRARACVTQG